MRLPIHHLIRYKVVGKEELQGTLSFVRNISAGGVLFHTQQSVPTPSTLELEINFPLRPEPIKVFAKALRIKPLKKFGGYDIAIEFLNLDEDTRTFVNEKILNVYEKTKGGDIMKKGAILFLLIALIAALLGIIIKTKPGLGGIPLIGLTWMRVTDTCLLFYIALSLLRRE